ncbi:MAG TPA: metallophosphoesterase [Pirellulales bacterium]|nr:metallophosphoesterase [Pirellulales bacterium]
MFWTNVLILLALLAGHVELLVMLVNRLHALPLPHGLLRPIRHLHDVVLVGSPFAWLWFLGLGGPGLLVGGSWSRVHPAWIGYLALCGLGTVCLVGSALVFRFQRRPRAQLSNHSRLVDVADRLGFRPLGEGPYQLFARVPGNQLFQLEVSEKEYRLPRLPADWDGLSIVHLSDLHFHGTLDRPYYEEVMRLAADMSPDMVVFTGDLLDDQCLVEWLPATLGKLRAAMGCYFILGNHDWYLEPEPIRRRLVELGWHDVSGTTLTIAHHGHHLVIGGTERPWMGGHPDFNSATAAHAPVAEYASVASAAEEIAGAPDFEAPNGTLTSSPTRCDVGTTSFKLLLSHTPDNLPWARREGVDLMLSGHNHGGQVVLPLVGPVYSPSFYGCRYAAGAFWREPTLLYVSRGISGKHPLRLGCPPELTKLVLRAER